jgi:hypothetical protein
LAHDQLAPREAGQIVKLPDYLRALCLSIKQQAEGIEIDVQADELELSIDRAVPLGLILNEAATVRHQRSLDRTGGLNKGEFLAHRNVHRSEDETANPTIEGTG